MRLFYTKPSDKMKLDFAKRANRFERYWEQASLPIGNGNAGLTLLGERKKTIAIVNFKTFWTGGPSPKRPDYAGGNLMGADADKKTRADYFFEVRRLFQEGRDAEASALCDKLIGVSDGYGAYQCYGSIEIRYKKIKKSKSGGFSRSLDLEEAVYRAERGDCLETAFATRPDNSAVIVLERKDGLPDFEVDFRSRHGAKVSADERGISHAGSLNDNGLKYAAALRLDTDGTVFVKNDTLIVKGARRACMVLSGDTDYYDDYPVYRTKESAESLQARVLKTAREALEKGADALLKRHKEDYRALYGRVELDLNGAIDRIPTDEAIEAYRNGKISAEDKRGLETLLYQYGRYLTIASSREGDLLPSNLQGIWNASDKPAWSSDFHLNINLQMNYWPTFSANLAECAKPLLRYVEKLRAPGRVTAEVYTGVKSEDGAENGYLFHTQNTPFGWTCPGWDFSWGWSPAAVAWILHNVYEYYEYTLNKHVLEAEIYPILKEAADYFASLLIESRDGRIVSCPCFSPEHGPRTMGNTYEQSLLDQLFRDASEAAGILKTDKELKEKWDAIRTKLRPVEIGEDGQIKEWYFEKKLGQIGQKRHRHLSHLLGLYPLNVIDRHKNPEYLDAAIVSLNDRGDESVGWAMAQRLCSRARTGDGNRAYALVENCLQKSIHKNLFDVHPPFQIDGNFGFVAGVNEMLFESHLGVIELLPALPDCWRTGSVKGLVARGNYEISMAWKDGKLEYADVLSRAGGEAKFRLKSAALDSDRGFSSDGNGNLVVKTQAGDRFRLTPKKTV